MPGNHHVRAEWLPLLVLSGCSGSALPPPDNTTGACADIRIEMTQELDTSALLWSVSSEEPDFVGPGIAVADIDADGWLDVVLAASVSPIRILLNDGAGTLLPDDSFTRDGGALPSAHGISAADLDGDGDIDLVLARSSGLDDLVLWRTGASAFTTEILEDSQGHSTTPSLADLDGDGLLDLFMARHHANPVEEDIRLGLIKGDRNSLYLQRDGAMRRDAGLIESGSTGFTFQTMPVDINRDGALDLYAANDFGWLDTPNQLLINDGTGSFTVAGAEYGESQTAMSAMGVAVSDFNGDHAPDLYITNIGSPLMLFSEPGTGVLTDFTHAWPGAEIPLSPEHTASWGAAAVDLNQDGFSELVVAFGTVLHWIEDSVLTVPGGQQTTDSALQRNVLLYGESDGFTDISAEQGLDSPDVGRSIAVGDLDRDGMPDLITAGWREGTPYLQVFSARDGCGSGVTVQTEHIGATIIAEVGDRTTTHWSLPATVFSASAAEITIGLAGAQAADRITLQRPGHSDVIWQDIAAGSLLVP